MAIDTEPQACGSLPNLRLMQLISPSLPIGAFTYSQGIEYAVEAGWINSGTELENWLQGQMEQGLAFVELPLLARLYDACAQQDPGALAHWNQYLFASRETGELREEERNRGRALRRLLLDLGVLSPTDEGLPETLSQTAGFAIAAAHWQVPLSDTAAGFAWSWLENLVTAGVKLIPLGQTEGQQVLLRLSGKMPRILERGLALDDESIGASAPMQAIASALHESQYTRLFRS